jgi:hypothetical protein
MYGLKPVPFKLKPVPFKLTWRHFICYKGCWIPLVEPRNPGR